MIGGKMEKLIYDADSDAVCTGGGPCPKFVIDEQKQVISLIDKKGNRADMSVEHFNRFVRAVKTGEIREFTSVMRK